jgi:hypothetical protein
MRKHNEGSATAHEQDQEPEIVLQGEQAELLQRILEDDGHVNHIDLMLTIGIEALEMGHLGNKLYADYFYAVTILMRFFACVRKNQPTLQDD